MKVWLCSTGCYSDKYVTAVYTDEAIAHQVSKAYGWDNDPEEYDLDPEVPQEVRAGMSFWAVRLWENGDLERTWITEPSEWYLKDGWDDAPYMSPRHDRVFRTGCWARDQEHAVKIANERRAMSIATSAV